MDIERLEELKKEVAESNLKVTGVGYLTDLQDLINAEIARQSVASEEVQIEINRLQESLKQTKEAADELKGKKYAVNMKPVYDQIKSLELQITALRQYQKPTDEGRFPDEAEREYNANYEAKCKKTGVNLLAEPSDADVRAALEDLEEAEREDNRIYYCGNVQKSAHELNIETIWWSITALQAYQPWIPVSERLPERPEYDWVLVQITLSPDGFVCIPHVAELRRGKWFSMEYDLPIEQILQGTVTHWMPLPEPPKGE